MKKYWVILLMQVQFVVAWGATTIKETFATFSGTYGTATVVSLPSGDWTMCGVAANQSNGVVAVKCNANNAYLISPQFENLVKVSFAYRSGGSNKKVHVDCTVDGGATWMPLDEFTIASSSSSYATYTKSLLLEDATGVQVRVFSVSSNVYIKDFVATLDAEGAGGEEPIPSDPTYDPAGVPVPTKPFVEAVNTYYISPKGNDETGNGSMEAPWYNIAVAYDAAQPGDHIVCRGGTYHISKYGTDGKLTVRMNKKATSDRPITIRSYEDEIPVFDFEQQLLDCNRDRSKVGDRGIMLTGNHHVLFGIHVMHAADNGIKLEGSYNRIERCVFSYNLDTGLQLGFGHDFSASFPGISHNDGTYCAYNDIVDCDSHHNCDFDMNYGSDADGFACKMHNGIGNRFIRCRAWRNSDDAWDLYETDYSVVMAECWAWESGKASDHLWVKDYLDGSASFSGNGNGIKLGGNGSGGSSKGVHYAYNCISFGHNKTSSVKGFDCNSHKDGHVLIGCLGFDCGYDFMFESGGSDEKTAFYNNVCLGRQEICVGSDAYNAVCTPPSKNAWSVHLLTGVTKDDFVSLSEEDALKPRSADGSLPREFGRIRPDSRLVDAGSSQYGLPEELLADFPFLRQEVSGNQRDMGPYEYVNPDPLSIRDVRMGNSKDARMYNLYGQPVDEHYKGIVIKEGKCCWVW